MNTLTIPYEDTFNITFNDTLRKLPEPQRNTLKQKRREAKGRGEGEGRGLW